MSSALQQPCLDSSLRSFSPNLMEGVFYREKGSSTEFATTSNTEDTPTWGCATPWLGGITLKAERVERSWRRGSIHPGSQSTYERHPRVLIRNLTPGRGHSLRPIGLLTNRHPARYT